MRSSLRIPRKILVLKKEPPQSRENSRRHIVASGVLTRKREKRLMKF